MNKLITLTLALFLACFMYSCKGDKATTTAEAAKTVQAASGSSYNVDASKSSIMWTGSKPTGTHTGTINVSEGSVSVDNGNVTGGKFTIDMNSIASTDLNGDMRKNLEAHLKGTSAGKENDFFNVSKFPTATFEITSIKNLVNNKTATHLVYGNLTLKGITKSVSFPATIMDRGNNIGMRSNKFTINRTDWDIKFKSKSFFDDLKDNFIDDEIELLISVIANK